MLTIPISETFDEIIAPNGYSTIGADNMTAILIYFNRNMGLGDNI